MKIGNAIKECRTRAKLTQLQLAKKAKVTQGYIANVEKNNLVPTQKVLRKIANAIDIPIIVLILIATEEQDVRMVKPKLMTSLNLTRLAIKEAYGQPAN